MTRVTGFGRGSLLMTLSVTAILWAQPAGAWLSASRTWLDFPNTKAGGSWTDYVYIYNFGKTDANNIYVSGSCFRDFSMAHNCFFDLRAGQNCSITIRYQPSRSGSHSCSITVSSSNQGSVSISVTGNSN